MSVCVFVFVAKWREDVDFELPICFIESSFTFWELNW